VIPVLLAAAVIIELRGSFCLVTPYHALLAAFAMFLYMIAVTMLFHNYWAASSIMAAI